MPRSWWCQLWTWLRLHWLDDVKIGEKEGEDGDIDETAIVEEGRVKSFWTDTM